jgi:DNA replicative helicase MCM subunit Mcm2 (Cdc46/Mcm family)
MVRQFMDYHNPAVGVTWQEFLDWQPINEGGMFRQFTRAQWDVLLAGARSTKDDGRVEEFVNVLREVGLKQIKGFPITYIRDLGADFANNLIAVEGHVVGISELEPHWSTIFYECTNCHEKFVPTNEKQLNPAKCKACNEKTMNMRYKDTRKSSQAILLQEEELTLSTVYSGTEQEMWAVKQGQRAYGLGILRFEQTINKITKKNQYRKYLELLHIEPIIQEEVQVTAEDKLKFEKEAENADDLYELVVNSFAPHIRGMRTEKEVCIYVLASQGLERPNNGILLGPSGRGKSKLLFYTTLIPEHATYQTFGDASAVGLTASTVVDKATGMLINKRGILSIYDGGVVAITEFQSIQEKKDLKTLLNDALDRKKVSIAKAGGHQEFNARCACLFDSNNFEGRWDYSMSLSYNLQFLAPNIGPTLSRMDLASVVSQSMTPEEDDMIADVNFDTYSITENPTELHLEDWETENHEKRWGFNTLRKFFKYVCSLPQPKIDPSLKQYYKECYRKVKEHDQDWLVDGRYHESVMRQTHVRARMTLKAVGDKRDLDEAMRLVNKSKNVTVSTNLIDPDAPTDSTYYKGVPSKHATTAFFSEEEELRASIEDILKQSGGKDTFMLSELQDYVVDKLKLPNWNKTKIKNTVNRWAFHTNQLREVGAPGSQEFSPTQSPTKGREQKWFD